jgi:ATP-binding cassette, subfamily B, bacterial
VAEFSIETPFAGRQQTAGRWLISHLQRQKLLFIAMLIGAFGNALLAAALPILVGIAFDAALATPANIQLIGLAAIGIIVSQFTRAILQLGRNFASSVIGERLERDTRQELYLNLLGKSMTFHDLQPVGDTMA